MLRNLLLIAALVCGVYYGVQHWAASRPEPRAAATREDAPIARSDLAKPDLAKPDVARSDDEAGAPPPSTTYLGNELEDDARRTFEAARRSAEDARKAAEDRSKAAATSEAALEVQLAAAQRDAAAQIKGLQARLDIEQARSASLERDLAGVREQNAQAARDADDAGRAAEATARDGQAKLDEERKATAALTAAVADARRDAAAQVSTLQTRLAGEQGRTADLNRDLAATRERLAQASGTQVVAQEDAKLAAERKRADDLAGQLADAGRAAAAQVDDLHKQLAGEQDRSADLGRDLTAAQTEAAKAKRDGTQAVADAQAARVAAEAREAKLRDEQAQTSSAATAATARVDDLQRQLAKEQDRSASLDHDLTTAQAQVAQAKRDGMQAAADAQAARVAAEAREAKLGDERAEASKVAAAAAGNAAAQIDDLRRQLAGEQDRSAKLDRDLAAAAAEARAAQLHEEQAQASGSATAAAQHAAAAQLDGLRGQLAGEQDRAAKLDRDLAAAQAELTQAKRGGAQAAAEAQQAAAAQVDAMRGQLAGEQDRSSRLDREVAAMRTRLAQAVGERTEAAEKARVLEAEAATDGAKLRDEQAKSSALAARLVTAQRGAVLQADDLQNRLKGEAGRVAELERALGDARAQLAQAARDATVAGAATPPRDAVARAFDPEAVVEGAARGVVAQAFNGSASRGASLAAVAGPGRTPAFRAEAVARVEPPSPEPRPAAAAGGAQQAMAVVRPSAATGTMADHAASGPSGAVPPDSLVHVIVRYARDSGSARARAMSLRVSLRAEGLDVSDPVGASVPADRVIYFYGEDQRSAARVAGVVDASHPVQSRPVRGPLPRPGTIEVAIAG